MRDHLNEPLTLQDMADIAYLSRNRFHRVFHRIIGIAPGEFLTALCLDALARCPPLTKLCVVPLSFERVFLRTGQMFGDVRGRDLCRSLSQAHSAVQASVLDVFDQPRPLHAYPRAWWQLLRASRCLPVSRSSARLSVT